MNQRLMVAVLVARAELQMTVEKQSDVVFETCQHDVLIACITREDDLIGINIVFRSCGDSLRLRQANAQPTNDGKAKTTQHPRGGQLSGKEKSAPQRN